jgi:hypothetical protein
LAADSEIATAALRKLAEGIGDRYGIDPTNGEEIGPGLADRLQRAAARNASGERATGGHL